VKKTYGEYVYLDKKHVAQLELMSEAEQFANLSIALLQSGAQIEDVVSGFSSLKLTLKKEKECMAGRCVHFFFKGQGFHDWLCECKTPMIGDQEKIFDAFKDDNGGGCLFPFMLHFEGGGSPVYLCAWTDSFNPITKQNWPGRVLHVSCGRNKHNYWYNPSAEQEGDRSEDTLRVKALMAGAMAYIQAFPEMVNEGIPSDLSRKNHFRGIIAKTVCISPSLVMRDGPRPHYRVGHFRYLSSERFTNKRWQTVFVHGAFIKGRAQTVLSPEIAEDQTTSS
jgi:hypothetical protein